jgi:hypothetical protein
MQKCLLTFEQEWTDEASERSLPKLVTDELHGFMDCGISGEVLRSFLAAPAACTTSWALRLELIPDATVRDRTARQAANARHLTHAGKVPVVVAAERVCLADLRHAGIASGHQLTAPYALVMCARHATNMCTAIGREARTAGRANETAIPRSAGLAFGNRCRLRARTRALRA